MHCIMILSMFSDACIRLPCRAAPKETDRLTGLTKATDEVSMYRCIRTFE